MITICSLPVISPTRNLKSVTNSVNNRISNSKIIYYTFHGYLHTYRPISSLSTLFWYSLTENCIRMCTIASSSNLSLTGIDLICCRNHNIRQNRLQLFEQTYKYKIHKDYITAVALYYKFPFRRIEMFFKTSPCPYLTLNFVSTVMLRFFKQLVVFNLSLKFSG